MLSYSYPNGICNSIFCRKHINLLLEQFIDVFLFLQAIYITILLRCLE